MSVLERSTVIPLPSPRPVMHANSPPLGLALVQILDRDMPNIRPVGAVKARHSEAQGCIDVSTGLCCAYVAISPSAAHEAGPRPCPLKDSSRFRCCSRCWMTIGFFLKIGSRDTLASPVGIA